MINNIKFYLKMLKLLIEKKDYINDSNIIYKIDKRIYAVLKESIPLICAFLKLDIRTVPDIHFSDNTCNDLSAVYYPEVKRIIVFPINMLKLKQNRILKILLINLIGSLAHELTHYNQYINGSLDINKYIDIFKDEVAYKKQACEKEAYRNQKIFLRNNYNQLLNIINKYFEEDFLK